MKKTEFEHIKKWEHPANYAGPEYPDYYAIYGQHRDSNTLKQSNFNTIIKRLGGESETVLIIRDSHWAVGWVEHIYIHESNLEALKIAENLLASIAEYPVLDEMDWSERENNYKQDVWQSINLKERVALCKRASASIFASRLDYVPEQVYDYINE